MLTEFYYDKVILFMTNIYCQFDQQMLLNILHVYFSCIIIETIYFWYTLQ